MFVKKRISLFFALLLSAMMLFSGCAAQAEDRVFVTSFYPMYVFAQNVVKDVPGVRVVNMTGSNAGCLHDYQLQTRDMVMLEDAAALVINGGGMEPFVDKVAGMYAGLPVINASAGIDMLCAEEESGHDHGHDGHDHAHAYNAHVWLNPAYAAIQVGNIAEGFAAADPENAQAYRDNAAAYQDKLAALDAEIRENLAPFAGRKMITFHEAFTYFAEAYGLEVVGVIAYDSGEEPGTREIAKTCDLVKAMGIKTLFIEPQYPSRAAETIARETGATIDTLDPVVSGDGAMDSYERIMRENTRVLTEAFSR